LDHLLVSVKFNAKSFDNPSRSNIAAIKVSDIRLEDNKLVFNFPFHRFNKSYLTIDFNIEGSSDNVYFISEDKKLISVERDEQFLLTLQRWIK
jgi:hypothetical protein